MSDPVTITIDKSKIHAVSRKIAEIINFIEKDGEKEADENKLDNR